MFDGGNQGRVIDLAFVDIQNSTFDRGMRAE